MEREKWQKRSAALISAALILVGIYILLKYALAVLLPFLVALGVSLPISSLAKRSSRSLGGGVKAWSGFYVAVFWLALALLLTLAIRRLQGEAEELISYLSENIGVISAEVERLTERSLGLSSDSALFSELGAVGERLGDGLTSALTGIGERLSEWLATSIGGLAVAMPRVVIGTVVAIVSSFYLCSDLDKIKDYLFGFIEEGSRQRVRGMLSQVLRGIKAYAAAYFWLFLITFLELYLGLLLLGRRYALLIALLLALVDMLPLFGAGVFVVPWGIILILQGDLRVGIGLLVLLGLMSIVRQIVEPRLVGKKLGIHPLASLCSMYVGLRLFGIWGMLLAPVAVLVIKETRSASERDTQPRRE